VNLYSLFVYIEHNGDGSPKDVADFVSIIFTLQYMQGSFDKLNNTSFLSTLQTLI